MAESFAISRVLSRQPKMRSVASVTPQVSGDHVFEVPAKLIKTPADMKIWEKSEAYFEYLGFILAVNEAIKGKSNSQGREKPSETVLKIIAMLDKLDARIEETPSIQQPQRFGNVAFRTWYHKMRDDTLLLLQDAFNPELYRAIPEIVSYLVESFGNSTRIDYGTGHELSFVMFLCCLFKVGLLKVSDKLAAGCYIFPRYLDLVRKLQKTYRMEPAGSHGVWSLDDYQFVPFIWGSSQLFAHPVIEPSMFLNQQILNELGEDFMFLTCIQYINSVKTGPFAEHSNQLWSISGVSSWSKINGGLIKMYKAEVLSKFPVVQHIIFGSLFTLKPMEQCTGMMIQKTSMVPPPVPYYRTSADTKESSQSSLQSKEDKISESSSQSSEKSTSSDFRSISNKSEVASIQTGSQEETSLAGSIQERASMQDSIPGRIKEIEPTEEELDEERTSRIRMSGHDSSKRSNASHDMENTAIESVRFSRIEVEDGDKVSFVDNQEPEHSRRSMRTAFHVEGKRGGQK